MFAQLLGPFGFFTLALAGIFWLAQILPLVEIIIDNGRTGFIFLEFSILILPNILIIIIPISAFISTIYTINRMFGDSEMVVVMAAGQSPLKIAKPTLCFGLLVMLSTYVLVIFLQPTATTRLSEKVKTLKQDALSLLLVEKQFIHPMKGISLYIRESSNIGEISGLFLHDQREIDFPATYSANNALLQQDNNELRLIMSKGTLQRFDREEGILNILDFEQFALDLSDLLKNTKPRKRRPIEYQISELLNPQQIIDQGGRRSAGAYFAEAHNKLSMPLLGFILPMIAVSLLLSSKYRRSGSGYRITFIATIGILTISATMLLKTWVVENPEAYFVLYLPGVVTFLLAIFSLLYANGNIRKPYPMVGRIS